MNWISRTAAGAMRPRQMAPLCALIISVFTVSGCATTHLLSRLVTGDWIGSPSHETIEWLGPEPTRNVTVEARLTTPPRVVCRQEVNEPAALSHRKNTPLKVGVRISTAFVGVAEMAAGGLPLLLTPADELTAGGIGALAFIAVDGLTAVILAAVIPSDTTESVRTLPPVTRTTELCPPGLRFELGMERFPILPNGEVLPEAATYIMREVVETGMAIGLRNGDTLTNTEVPPDIRCAWAAHLDHTAQRALCPQAPEVIRVPVPVPGRGPPPRRR